MIGSASHKLRGWSEHPAFPEYRPIGKREIIGQLFFVEWMRDRERYWTMIKFFWVAAPPQY